MVSTQCHGAPVTSVEGKRRQRHFRAWDKFQQQGTSRQQFLRTFGYTAVSDLTYRDL